MQDCNLVEYDATLATKGPTRTGAVFNSATNGKSAAGALDAGCRLYVNSNQGYGALSLLDSKANTLWTTAHFINPVADTLHPAASLHQGYRLYSENGLYWLTLQVRPWHHVCMGMCVCWVRAQAPASHSFPRPDHLHHGVRRLMAMWWSTLPREAHRSLPPRATSPTPHHCTPSA